MNKEDRIKIYTETVDIVMDGEYVTPGDELREFIYQDEMVKGTKFYGKKVKIDHDALERYDTYIDVNEVDCLNMAMHLQLNLGLNPAVLNMASFHTPGGGVTRGSAAQEESIFRRTNIFMSLYQFNEIGKQYGVDQREERYPLDYNFGGIYTPSVTVFRTPESDGCQLMEHPFTVDVISVPAVKRPRVENGKLVPWVVDTLKNKIRQIFDIALENGNDSLVLSAFGCGAYGTPPNEMARLFKEVLDSKNYKGVFKEIRFAILDVPSTNGEHNPDGNIKPFKEIFGK